MMMKKLKSFEQFVNESKVNEGLVSNGFYDDVNYIDFDGLEFDGFDDWVNKYRFDSFMTNELESEFNRLIDKSKEVDEDSFEEVNGESEAIDVEVYKFKGKFFGICYYAEEDFMLFFSKRDAKFWDKALESIS